MDRGHSTMDDEFEDLDTTSRRRALALLIYVFAIKFASNGDERMQMIEEAAKENGTNAFAVRSEVSKLVDELKYFMLNGASSRWTASNGGFLDVLNGTYAMRCVPIDQTTKNIVRGKFQCTLCGQIEKNCGYAVHFAGSPPIERGQDLPQYSAKSFHTSDPEQLAIAFSQYAKSYNSAACTSANDVSERRWPTSPYLGVVIPGETCLKRIFTAFSAQDFVPSVLDIVSSPEVEAMDVAFPFQVIPKKLVTMVASRLEQHFACARGAINPEYARHNKDDVFWTEIFERFSAGVGISIEDDAYAFLREGYSRMEKNVTKTGYCPDEEDRVVIRRKKRRRIVADEEEDVSDPGKEVDEESALQDFIEQDSDEGHVDEDRPTRPTPRWGQTSASRLGPFAVRRRAVHEPFAPPETRASRRRDDDEEGAPSTHAVSVADSEQEANPILHALASVDKHTARGLRAPPDNQIGSRRSTIIKLADLATSTLKEGDLTLSTGIFRAMELLTNTLSVHEVGCSLAPDQKVKRLKEVTDTLLSPIQKRLLLLGQVTEALCAAEAIIVAHELLA